MSSRICPDFISIDECLCVSDRYKKHSLGNVNGDFPLFFCYLVVVGYKGIFLLHFYLIIVYY